jgi:hypothetical protein
MYCNRNSYWITTLKQQRTMPSSQPGYDPLYKIRPVINTLTTKFQDVFRPEEALTTDEDICPCREHIYFRVRVYMKGKPHKYDINIFEMCELKSGYVCTLEVYTGANPANTDFKGSRHCHDQQKKMPKQAFSKKLKGGEKIVMHRDHLMAMKWRDLQDVYVLSTDHDDKVIKIQLSRGEHKKNKANFSG